MLNHHYYVPRAHYPYRPGLSSAQLRYIDIVSSQLQFNSDGIIFYASTPVLAAGCEPEDPSLLLRIFRRR